MTEESHELLWEPTAAAVEASNLTTYIDWLRAERGVDVTTYPELWQWSVDDLDGVLELDPRLLRGRL